MVVDGLSFTTSVSVALDHGTSVLPYRWQDDAAASFAHQHGAVLAVGRRVAGPGQVSLSPASLRANAPPARLVLPSPNGSAIAHHLSSSSTYVVAACWRNASAVAAWIDGRQAAHPMTVAVIAAGERWPDGSLRPAVEDWWAAGTVIDHLVSTGAWSPSPEASAARAAAVEVRGKELTSLLACASGRELAEAGFAHDVAIAAEVETSGSVPVLRDGAFISAGG